MHDLSLLENRSQNIDQIQDNTWMEKRWERGCPTPQNEALDC